MQVSRWQPLVNEVVIPLAVKDAFNSLNPSGDVAAGALRLVLDPEPARLLKALYNINVPTPPRPGGHLPHRHPRGASWGCPGPRPP